MPGTRSRLVRSLTRPTVMAGVAEGVCRQINAANAMDSVTGLFNARREEAREDDEEDVAVEAEEEAVVVVEAKTEVVRVQFAALAQSGPEASGGTLQQPPNASPVSPWRVTRETSCALSWPARTAVGAVGRSGAS